MSNIPTTCPKCAGKMEQGFTVDNTYGARGVSHWAGGHPEKSFWEGARSPEDTLIPIGTYRCRTCGYLESYARSNFAAR